ncbi:hypothetical protein HanIR_Chr05g0223371 [Helianthus annuus]|nr:hypothetical protein HanIR_Chr05g0223371 [Helianthus annuus]
MRRVRMMVCMHFIFSLIFPTYPETQVHKDKPIFCVDGFLQDLFLIVGMCDKFKSLIFLTMKGKKMIFDALKL